MVSGAGGAPGALGGLGAGSPLPSRPRCAAALRAVVSPGAHGGGDLRGALREVFERLVADSYLGVVSAASCVGASPLPPPPRCATSPNSSAAFIASHGCGGGDLRDSLREVFEWLVANRYVESVTSSPPRPPRCAAPARAFTASGAHGGGDLRGALRDVFERIIAEGFLGVVSAASCVGASSLPPRPRHDAPPPAVVKSDGRRGGDIRQPLRVLFEWLVAESCVLHLASPASGSPFRFCTINIGRFRASYLLNRNAQNSKAVLLMDMAEGYYPQGRPVFHQDHPRIQELNADGTTFNAHEEGDGLSDALAPFITKPKLSPQPSSDIGLKSRKAHVYATTNLNSAIRDFDRATNTQLIGSCTSVPQFCLSTDYTPRRSQFYCLHHEHATRTDRRMTREGLTCRRCENYAAAIQCLLRLNSIIEQKLEELSGHNIVAVQNISGDDTRPLQPEFQLIGSCTSAPQFCLTTDNMPGLHPEHEVRPQKPESAQSAEDSVGNLKEAIKAGERCDKQTSEDNPPEPDSEPNPPDTESVGNFTTPRLGWMLREAHFTSPFRITFCWLPRR